MSSYTDPLRAWQDAMARMLPGLAADQAELARALVAPLQQQAALLQDAFEQQRALQTDLGRRALAPLEELVRLVDEAARPMRQGAEAFGHRVDRAAPARRRARRSGLRGRVHGAGDARPARRADGALRSAAA
jgi:hypothetical protein